MKLLDAIFGETSVPVRHQDDPRLQEFGRQLNYQYARGNVLLQQGRELTKLEVKSRLAAIYEKLHRR
jgi:hypothetical protein